MTAYPDQGMEVIGIKVKKTVKQPNRKVLFSSVVTPAISRLIDIQRPRSVSSPVRYE